MSDTQTRREGRCSSRSLICTATPMASGDIWRHSVAVGGFAPAILNGLQRSVNRKVQGSNPCSGANVERPKQGLPPQLSDFAATVRQGQTWRPDTEPPTGTSSRTIGPKKPVPEPVF